jgi:hypothetical protein
MDGWMKNGGPACELTASKEAALAMAHGSLLFVGIVVLVNGPVPDVELEDCLRMTRPVETVASPARATEQSKKDLMFTDCAVGSLGMEHDFISRRQYVWWSFIYFYKDVTTYVRSLGNLPTCCEKDV